MHDVESTWMQLTLLLPGLSQEEEVDPHTAASLCGDLPAVVQRLMSLRCLFPTSDICTMVLRSRLWLADPSTSQDTVTDVTAKFRERFSAEDADRLLQTFPWLLDLTDQQHVHVSTAQMQQAFFGDHPGCMLDGGTVRAVVDFKAKLVEEMSTTDATDWSRMVTRERYGAQMYH